MPLIVAVLAPVLGRSLGYVQLKWDERCASAAGGCASSAVAPARGGSRLRPPAPEDAAAPATSEPQGAQLYETNY